MSLTSPGSAHSLSPLALASTPVVPEAVSVSTSASVSKEGQGKENLRVCEEQSPETSRQQYVDFRVKFMQKAFKALLAVNQSPIQLSPDLSQFNPKLQPSSLGYRQSGNPETRRSHVFATGLRG